MPVDVAPSVRVSTLQPTPGNDANSPLRISILGAGRMGRELIRVVAADKQLQLAGVWARQADALAGFDIDWQEHGGAVPSAGGDLDAVLQHADIVIDFSLPAATPQVLDAVRRANKPLVCGVTGLDESVLRQMRTVAASVPLLYDRNMSFGIAVLKDLVSRAAAALGHDFVASIHDIHHVHKVDAPSGTALKLGAALARARNQDFESVFRYAADGIAARNSHDDIVFSATRSGEVPGEHTVTFQSAAETLELAHKVTDRRVFADGALQAARWLVRQKPGLYGMSDIFA